MTLFHSVFVFCKYSLRSHLLASIAFLSSPNDLCIWTII